jgi:HSP20 family protein
VSKTKHDPMAELFGDFTERLRGDRWQPDVDVYETDANVVVRAEIAGVRSQDLSVSVDGQSLRIHGIRPAPEGPDVTRLHQMEIASGPFERRVQISIAFEKDRVSAHVGDGFLTVTLPKQSAGPRPVRVIADE